jgi:short-subunit dehydrogenase
MIMSYWQGKRAVITGGSAGLGRALADILVQQGARVAIVARRAEPLENAAGELRKMGGNVMAVTADVTIATDVERLAATVQSAWGGLDLLCNCAGRSMRGTVLTTAIEDFRNLWEVNFLSALYASQAFAPALAHSHGHIVLVGSLASKAAAAYLGAYPTSKFPLAALAQQMRLEFGEAGPHVLLVCPGPIAGNDEITASPAGRYAKQTAGLPASAQKPGGGAKIRAIDPRRLSEQILNACRERRVELIVPRKARLLFAISQLSPRLGDWILRRMTSG